MPVPVLKVLLVEDSPADALLLQAALDADQLSVFELTLAERLAQAQNLLSSRSFDLVLLDLGLPDSQGLETFLTCQQYAPHLPIVVFSGNMDEVAAVEAVRAGAQDYLLKSPAAFEMSPRTIRYAIERHKLRQSLWESEANLAEAQKTAKLGSWKFNIATNAVNWSKELYRVFDIEPAEFGEVYESFLNRVYPDDRPLVLMTNHKARKTGEPFDVEYRIQTRSGKLKYIREVGYATQGPDGKVTGLFGIAQDITEHKQIESILAATQQRLQAVISSAMDAIISADGELNVVMFNEAAEKMFGLPASAALGQPLNRFIPDRYQRVHEQHMQGLNAEFIRRIPIGHVFSVVGRRSNGEEFPAESSISYIETGSEKLFTAILRDVTERKIAEEALRRSNETAKAILNAATESVFLMELDGTVIAANETTATRLGKSLKEIIGANMYDFLPPAVVESRKKRMESVVANRRPAFFEDERLGKWIENSIYPIFEEDGTLCRVAIYGRDITERKQAEDERQRLLDALSARTTELGLLLEAGQALSESLDRRQIYEIIYRYIRKALPCEMLVISAYDSQNGLITCEYLQTEAGPQDVTSFPPIPIEPPGQGTQSRVLHSGESLLLPDYVEALKTARTTYYFDEQAQIVEPPPQEDEQVERARSAILVPLKVDGQVVGAMQIFSMRRHAHTPEHLRFVEALAFHISAALSNARLFSELEQRVQERTLEIQTTRQRLELATQAAELGVWDWDIQSGNLLWDEQMARNYGIAPRAFQGTLESFMSFVHPEDLNDLMTYAQETLQGKVHNQVNYRVIRGDGSTGYVKAHGIVLRAADGQPTHVIGVTQDVTQEKLAELALRESEEMYRSLFETTNDAIFLIDIASSKYMRVNPRCYELLGVPASESLVGKSSLDFIVTEQHGDAEAHLHKLLSGERVMPYERLFRRWDGTSVITEINLSLIRDLQGNPLFVQSIVRDITERKQSEMALRESEAQNRLLFEEVPDAITLLNAEGKFLRINRAYEQLVHIPANEMLGKTAIELGLVTEDSLRELTQAMEQAIARNENFARAEYVLYTRDNKALNVESRIFLLKLGGPDQLLVTTRDISMHKKAEEALRLANAEMSRALRLKDEFLANMSHELRTPLNAILGISESLEEQVVGPLNPKQQHYIRTVSESGRHLLALINDILDLSKIEAGRMELSFQEVGAESLVQSSLRMIKELAGKKNLQVTSSVDRQVQTVRADERRLKQVLVNLLSNAVKFTPAQGQIGLEISGDPLAEQVTFTIWDTGIGIKVEDLPRLFQPFVQLDAGLNREHAGTGLGLALVSEIVRLHGGRVSVQSQPGTGSRFSVILPWRPEKQKQGQRSAVTELPTQPLAPRLQSRRGKVLLVEDTESVILFVEDYLQALGYQVIVARDGLAGVTAAQEQHPDLILMDIQMPGMDGFEAARIIRDDPALNQIPIIALTALAMPGDRERCLAAGMQAYLSKPISLKELAKVSHAYLQKSRRKHL